MKHMLIFNMGTSMENGESVNVYIFILIFVSNLKHLVSSYYTQLIQRFVTIKNHEN